MDTDFSADTAALNSLRDGLRSARRWQELLTDHDRRTLLNDIAHTALAVGRDLNPDRSLFDLDLADAPSRTPGDACPHERIAFLSKVWPRVTHALTILENETPFALVPSTQTVTLERARRITPQELLRAVRKGDFVSASPQIPLAAALGERIPRYVREQVALPNSNTPAYAAIKTLMTVWAHDLAAAVTLATEAGASEVAADAERLRRRLRSHLCREPWCRLSPAPSLLVSPMPPALLSHRAHFLLHDTYRRYRAGFAFDWTLPIFSLPSRETHLLYEYWCLFQTVSALRNLGFRAVSAGDFRVSRTGLAFGLKKGTASRLVFRRSSDGRRVSVTYNRVFRRATADPADHWHSRSHEMQPDIVLESGGKLLVLDAKFKTYAGNQWESEELNQAEDTLSAREGDKRRWHFAAGTMHPDIQQMHSYRDAIAYCNERNMVWGAWILYAGRSDVSNPAVVSFPRNSENLFGNHELGAICLRPGAEPKVLQQLIFLFLNDIPRFERS